MSLNVGWSIVLGTLIYLSSTPFLLKILPAADVPLSAQIISNFALAMAFVIGLRLSIYKDLKLFILSENNLELAKKEKSAREAIESAQLKLVESERMAELGRLAGTVAYEINSVNWLTIKAYSIHFNVSVGLRNARIKSDLNSKYLGWKGVTFTSVEKSDISAGAKKVYFFFKLKYNFLCSFFSLF
jgi:hypothetical protein